LAGVPLFLPLVLAPGFLLQICIKEVRERALLLVGAAAAALSLILSHPSLPSPPYLAGVHQKTPRLQ
jgi:hypothetical protein